MSQISHGTITVTDMTDITDVYYEYGLAVAGATVTNSYPFSGTGEIGWSTTYPTWASGYQIWKREVTVKEGITLPDYGTPFLDTAVNQINNQYINLNAKVKNYWWDSNGAHMASGINGGEVDKNSPVSAYGFNSLVGLSNINFRYNAIPILQMGLYDEGSSNFNGLKIYNPIVDNGTIINSTLGMSINSDEINFYNQNGDSIAQYGDTARVGNENGSYFLIKEDSLQAYDSSNQLYFKVDSTGIAYGDSHTVADTTYADDSVGRYITTQIGSNGISVHPEGNINNGVNIGDYIEIKTNGKVVASYGENMVIGDIDNFYISMGIIYIKVTNPTNPLANHYVEKTIVSNPLEDPSTNPKANKWYEFNANKEELRLTEHTVVYSGTNYYTISESTDTITDINKTYYQSQPRLSFYQKNEEVAYITNNQLYITQSVVLQQMDLGQPNSRGGLGQWSWKIHPNGQNPSRNNLNLKWVG